MPRHDCKVLSVSELTAGVKALLEDGFPAVTVEGEISNFRPASSGHWYFNLKDREAMIQAVMFRGKSRQVGFEPGDGMLVRASGAVTVYAARGQYQLLVDRMEEAGVGDLLVRLEELKRRLAAEGLFDEARKRPLPRFPRRVAVVTSPTGAAIRDILTVLERRNAGIAVTIVPAAVQGEAAPAELVAGVRAANRHGLGDVIILGRGGGSLEDLAAFSDESLVREVASSAIPVISAVGHEIDWALTDFAADLRAPTPSAAAELVSESREAMASEIAQLAIELETGIASRLERSRALLARFEPESIEGRFMRLLHPAIRGLDEAKTILANRMGQRLAEARHRVGIASAGLGAGSPEAILARGYAVVRERETGRVIRSSRGLAAGSLIDASFASGSVGARIEEVRK